MRFGGLVAVNDLSFEAGRGDITALIGPNGAGKTTVFNCITGFYKPTEGMIALRQPDGAALPARAAARPPINWKAKVARTFQNIRLFSGMTVLENLLVAQHNPLMIASGFTFLGVLGVGGYREAEARGDRAGEVLAREDPPHRPRRRSGRRPSLRRPAPARDRPRHVHRPAAALPRRAGGRPQPARVASSSTSSCASIRDEHGTSILLIEHDMSVVMEISDHVVVLDYGTKISDGTPVRGAERSRASSPPISASRTRKRSTQGRSGGRRMNVAGPRTSSSRRPAPQPLRASRSSASAASRPIYGNIIALKGVDLDVQRGRDRHADRRQRRRQVDPDDDDLRQSAGARGHHHLRRPRHHADADARDRAPGDRAVAGRAAASSRA